MHLHQANDALLVAIRAFLRCGGAVTATALLLYVNVAPQQMHELSGLFIWTVPFCFAVAIFCLIVRGLVVHLPVVLSYGLAIFLGLLAGLVWGFIVYGVFVNPLFGTFSIPVSLPWAAGGISGLFEIAGLRVQRGRIRWLFEAIATGALCLLLSVGLSFLSRNLSGSRTIQTVWFKWEPSDNALSFKRGSFLTQDELARLTKFNITGSLEWQGTDGRGSGPISRMIIVMQMPIDEAVELPILITESVIYVQQADGTWRMDPSENPATGRILRLERHPDFPHITSAVYEYPQGGSSRFGGINWTGEPLP